METKDPRDDWHRPGAWQPLNESDCVIESSCCIHDCGKPVVGKFLCVKHYNRMRRTGTTDLKAKPKKKCRMPQCDGKHFQHGWCSKHFQRIVNSGSPFDKDQKWVISDHETCLACGERFTPEYGVKRYCSVACRTMFSRVGVRPDVQECTRCGTHIDMTARGPSGARKSRNVRLCSACSGSPNMARFVPVLIERDGPDCRLCGKVVDLSLKYPDPMSRAVDHIIPRSLGGPDEVSNYQISHSACNNRKKNRIDVAV